MNYETMTDREIAIAARVKELEEALSEIHKEAQREFAMYDVSGLGKKVAAVLNKEVRHD